PEAKVGADRLIAERTYVLKNRTHSSATSGSPTSIAARPMLRVATAIAWTASLRWTGVSPTMSTKFDITTYSNHVRARLTSLMIWSDAPGSSAWPTLNHSASRVFFLAGM